MYALVALVGLGLATACSSGPSQQSHDGGAADASQPASDLAAVDAAFDASAADLAALPDATLSDLGSGGALSIGAAAIAQRIYSTNPATGTLTTAAVTTQSGSLLLASAARGSWSAAPDAPTDSFANAFAIVGATHAYAAWPTSATGLYRALDAGGGAGHTFSLTWGDIGGTGDEISLSVVEVRGVTTIEDASWVERTAASPITSAPVTTSGPAILVAWWWGSGGVRPQDSLHVALPGDGFTIMPAATGLKSLSASGYIQVAVATRIVAAAGTYTVTWTTDDEGAQLYLVALR